MKNKWFPISMTFLWSMVFMTAMHSWTGIFTGLCMGIVFGLFDPEQKEKTREVQNHAEH